MARRSRNRRTSAEEKTLTALLQRVQEMGPYDRYLLGEYEEYFCVYCGGHSYEPGVHKDGCPYVAVFGV